jgi:hypothetical protein
MTPVRPAFISSTASAIAALSFRPVLIGAPSAKGKKRVPI